MTGYWKIPKIWEGETAFILGGGASVISQFGIPEDLAEAVQKGKEPASVFSPYMKSLHDKKVIGVNSAFKIGDWMDYIYFLDKDFMLTWRGALSAYPNPVVSALEYSEGESWCHTVKGNTIRGLSAMPNTVSLNRNSGAGAINLAYHLGSKKIVLIGFDMKLTEGKQHFHGEYVNSELVRPDEEEVSFNSVIMNFGAVANDAEYLGIEIINTSLDSGLSYFKKVPLEEVLQ